MSAWQFEDVAALAVEANGSLPLPLCDWTPEQLAKVAAFEDAVTPPEVVEAAVIEEVARALWAYDDGTDDSWHEARDVERADYRGSAAAAVAAYRAQDGDLRTRMADIADNLDYYAGKTDGGTYAGGLADAAGHIRDALAGVQDGGAEEAVRRGSVPADERDAMCLVDRAALATQVVDGAR